MNTRGAPPPQAPVYSKVIWSPFSTATSRFAFSYDVPAGCPVLSRVVEQFHEVLEGSSQPMYVFLDEQHKVCNQRLAALLGYASPAEWDQPGSFTEQYVDPGSRAALVSTYRRAMEEKAGSSVAVTWITKNGAPVPTNVILVPIAYEGELLALHFLTPT